MPKVTKNALSALSLYLTLFLIVWIVYSNSHSCQRWLSVVYIAHLTWMKTVCVYFLISLFVAFFYVHLVLDFYKVVWNSGLSDGNVWAFLFESFSSNIFSPRALLVSLRRSLSGLCCVLRLKLGQLCSGRSRRASKQKETSHNASVHSEEQTILWKMWREELARSEWVWKYEQYISIPYPCVCVCVVLTSDVQMMISFSSGVLSCASVMDCVSVPHVYIF